MYIYSFELHSWAKKNLKSTSYNWSKCIWICCKFLANLDAQDFHSDVRISHLFLWSFGIIFHIFWMKRLGVVYFQLFISICGNYPSNVGPTYEQLLFPNVYKIEMLKYGFILP